MDYLCRTCMCSFAVELPMRYYIYEINNLADKVARCTSLSIDPSDNYPVWICNRCYEKVEEIWEFQEMCRKSIENFDEMVNIVRKTVGLKKKQETAQILTADNVLAKSDAFEETPVSKIEISTATSVNSSKQVKQASTQKKLCEREKTEQTTKGNIDHTTTLYNASERIEENPMPPDGTSSISESSDRRDILFHKPCSIHDTFSLKDITDQQSKQKNLTGTWNRCDILINHGESNLVQLLLKELPGSSDVLQCDINNCERVYKNKSALNVHKRKYHNYGPELKTHMCEICGKVFKSSAVLNEHHFTHVEKSQLPFNCDEPNCPKRFSNREKLRIHKMRHAGIKNYVCPYCGVGKTTRNELKIHINYHTLERTWPCRFCAKICLSAGNLKMHVRSIHERAKDFACLYCDRMFAKADTRKYHEMTHTGEKPHECNECGRRFLQPAALRTHRKVHRKNEVKMEDSEEVKSSITMEKTSELSNSSVETEGMSI